MDPTLTYDVFLSHHTADTFQAQELARRLEDAGIKVWLGNWNLPAGQGWQILIERALLSCSAFVVFVGSHNLGPWQEIETEVAIDRWIRSARTFPLITVLLPGADRYSVRPFLNTSTWVEFKQTIDDEEAFKKLVRGIRGDFVLQTKMADIAVLPSTYPLLHPAHLPTQASMLIGREQEAREIIKLLKSKTRLVSLIGPSGIGKTRLALEMSSHLQKHFTHGVCFVDLTPARDANLAIRLIAKAIGIFEERNPTVKTISQFLSKKMTLLILDGINQETDIISLVNEISTGNNPNKILITSNKELGLSEEHIYVVQPLALPNIHSLPSIPQLEQIAAVHLFIERAKAVQSNFKLSEENARIVADICVQLEGNPLAIELAAARSWIFSSRLISQWISHLLEFSSNNNLHERTRAFAGGIIKIYQELNQGHQSNDAVIFIAKQLLQSGTTVAVKHLEAKYTYHCSDPSTKLKETLQELEKTALWLSFLSEQDTPSKEAILHLANEANQLISIFITCRN